MADKSKIADIYKKYAPKNITLQEFTEMVEREPDLLDSIGGEFSTFNPEFAKIYKSRRKSGGIPDDDFRNKMKDSMGKDAMATVAEKQAAIYADIICSDDDILLGALTFATLDRNQRKNLAIKIIDGINKRLGIDTKLGILYINKRNQQPVLNQLDDMMNYVLKTISNKLKKTDYKPRKWAGYYQNKQIVMLNAKDFLEFMEVLSHEYGHFIDHKYPDLGMLGSQIAFYGRKIYSDDESDEIYKSNPTEVSSFKIAKVVEDRIADVLGDQIQKKPGLYAKILQRRIDYAEMKIAAIRLKYRKLFKSVETAEQKYQDLKTKVLTDLYPDYEKMPPLQLADAVFRVNQMPEVEKLHDEYLLKKNKIPLAYRDTEWALDEDKKALKKYKSEAKEFLSSHMAKSYML